eukprot:357293-Chlamydomonas_euryale.AAC.10
MTSKAGWRLPRYSLPRRSSRRCGRLSCGGALWGRFRGVAAGAAAAAQTGARCSRGSRSSRDRGSTRWKQQKRHG